MFELELLELLNKLKRTNDNYEINKIKESITNLIAQNNDKYKNFLSKQELDFPTKKILEECENLVMQKKAQENNESQNDFETIKNYYTSWLNYYEKNNKIADENCEKIILQIINFYILNRYNVLEKIFSINDSEDYESFKNMLKNYIRRYYAEKIENYIESDNYKTLGFFEKRKKKNQILNLLTQIGDYKFNPKLIGEVLE